MAQQGIFYLLHRAKAEERYGRDLIQLAKQAGGREEIGYTATLIV